MMRETVSRDEFSRLEGRVDTMEVDLARVGVQLENVTGQLKDTTETLKETNRTLQSLQTSSAIGRAYRRAFWPSVTVLLAIIGYLTGVRFPL